MESLDATAQFDQIIANYESITLTVYITLAVIVVALIALGSEFWVNLWGALFFPSVTFQRVLGEGQWFPGLVIICVTGLSSAAIILSYISDPALTQWFTNIDIQNAPVIGPLLSSMDNMLSQVGWDKSLISIFKYMQQNAFQVQTIAVAVPIVYLVFWFLWCLSAQLGSMIAGNKAGHGLTSLWSGTPYTFLISILSVWAFMFSKYGHGWARVLFILTIIYWLFEQVVLMREHGRYQISKAIVAVILTHVLTVVMIYLLVALIVFATIQLAAYL